MVFILLALIVFGLDYWTKWLVTSRMTEFQEIPIIENLFSLEFVYNPGASFGILAGQQWLLIPVSIIAIGAMLWFLRHPEAKDGVVPYALGLLIGGAAGNLLDRIQHGKVVDFLLFYWRDYHFPNFNVADIAISVGVGLFILHLILNGGKETA